MFEYINFISDKKSLIDKIEKVKNSMEELTELGIDIDEALKKLENAIECVKSEKISIVLVGAFSDGKTSVIAGWLNEKMSNMKIDSDESSDEILKYQPRSLPDGCEIIDTPGLFGDKKVEDEKGGQIILSDMTKKYISEANIVLYVVTAKNPIKDSHKSCINWILNDLNKLSSTIFVINRMDDVADLTDDEEFERQKQIKTETLRSKLLECGVSKQNADQVKVVCISAAPNSKGIEEWEKYRDEYLRRSRINSLEMETNTILKNSHDELIVKTGCDILNDEIHKIMAEIDRQETAIQEIIIPEKKESLNRNKKDLENLRRRIVKSRGDIKDELKQLNKSKITKIRACTLENFKEVMEDEIGIVPEKEGYVLAEDVCSIFDRYAETYSNWAIDLGDKFQAEYDKQNKTVENLLKKGAAGAAAGMKGAGAVGVNAFKQAIFAGRDLISKLGVVIKFKPWQVVKMAKFATKALPIIGAAVDVIMNVVDNIVAEERNRKFEKNKDSIKDAINASFLEWMGQINDNEWFFDNFAPGLKILEDQIKNDEKDIAELETKLEKYQKWAKKTIDMEDIVS